jgi:hypothetical protein
MDEQPDDDVMHLDGLVAYLLAADNVSRLPQAV